jgi:hypothetical protein
MLDKMSNGNGYPPMHAVHRRPDPNQMAKDLLASADSNGDGSISKSEFELLMQNAGKSDATTINNLFAYLDQNSDGSVSSQETTDAIAAMVDQMRGHVMNAGTPFHPAAAAVENARGRVDGDGDRDGGRGESGNEASERQALLSNAAAGQATANVPNASSRIAFMIQGLLHQYQETQADTPSQTTSLLSTSA